MHDTEEESDDDDEDDKDDDKLDASECKADRVTCMPTLSPTSMRGAGGNL